METLQRSGMERREGEQSKSRAAFPLEALRWFVKEALCQGCFSDVLHHQREMKRLRATGGSKCVARIDLCGKDSKKV